MMETAWPKNSKTTRYGSGSRAAAGDLKRKAILAVSFGTSYRKTRDAAIGAIESDLQAAYPDYTVRRAFTSRMILKKLRERDGLHKECAGGKKGDYRGLSELCTILQRAWSRVYIGLL